MSKSRRKKLQREEMLRRQAAERKREKFMTPVKTEKVEFVEYAPKKSYLRETPEYASLTSTDQIHGTQKERHEYTGDYITGLATMHKSNIVPVGKGDDAESYAKMRR